MIVLQRPAPSNWTETLERHSRPILGFLHNSKDMDWGWRLPLASEKKMRCELLPVCHNLVFGYWILHSALGLSGYHVSWPHQLLSWRYSHSFPYTPTDMLATTTLNVCRADPLRSCIDIKFLNNSAGDGETNSSKVTWLPYVQATVVMLKSDAFLRSKGFPCLRSSDRGQWVY